ncbi:MAG: HD domain-containing phosphohydrolase [Nitrospirota bacterium]|nr:HD domain-containing phosphohydrolase [Nitrospirota bacterium]
MQDKVFEFISYIITALSNCSLYSDSHPAVIYHAEKAVKVMDDLFVEDTISLAIIGSNMIFNDVPFAAKNILVSNLIKRLRRKGIEKIVFTKGVTAEELKGFIAEIAFSKRISGIYPHITSGIIEVNVKTDDGDIRAIMEINIAKVKEAYQGFSGDKTLDMLGLEDVVLSLVSSLTREAGIFNIISPVKSYSEYTYAHAANVSVLSIFQAETLGIKGELLHDIGLAGLLHDFGKVFVSKEILEKKSKPSLEEWIEIKKHPVYGVMYLSRLSDVPNLALIAAFEHHMKYDSTGYPETNRRSKKQHIISQIIAISDFFDALRTERPYRQALDVPVIIGLLMEASGKDFNPILVESFLNSLSSVRQL